MGFVDRLTGKTAANAAKKAGEVQAGAAGEAKALFDHLAAVGQTGVEQAGFLTDPQAQYDFLQSNPLFQQSLNRITDGVLKGAAAQGRLTSGDTLEQLSQSTLLAAQPLIAGQKQSIADLLNLGTSVAGSQGNLLTGQAAATAGGIVGAENARGQGYQNIIDIGGKIAGGLFG